MKEQYFSPDVSEFLYLLSKYKVKYLIVGGEAVIYYGHARLTGDIDLYYDTKIENIKNLFIVLKEFWNGSIPGNINERELMNDGMIFQFGVPPNRIDLINKIENVNFSEAWKNRKGVFITHSRKKFKIHYIGLNDLIRNKEAVNRNRDRDDLKFLKAIKKIRK